MDELRTKHASVLKKEGRNKFEKFVAEEQRELRKLLADGHPWLWLMILI